MHCGNKLSPDNSKNPIHYLTNIAGGTKGNLYPFTFQNISAHIQTPMFNKKDHMGFKSQWSKYTNICLC